MRVEETANNLSVSLRGQPVEPASWRRLELTRKHLSYGLALVRADLTGRQKSSLVDSLVGSGQASECM